jgi:nitrilase
LIGGITDVPDVTTVLARDAYLESLAGDIRNRLEVEVHDLVVLPELSSITYSRESFANLAELVEPLDGPSFQVFSQLAKEFNVTILYGMPRINGDTYCISQVAVDGQGVLLGYYDKLHMAQFGASMEKDYFTKGDHLFTFEVKGVKVAPIICYDLRFPDLCRVLAVEHDVDLILHAVAFARDQSFDSWHSFCTARAMENQLFFLSLNRAGEVFGNSVFCLPWMDETKPAIAFPEYEVAFLSLELNCDIIKSARQSYTFLADDFGDYSKLPCK